MGFYRPPVRQLAGGSVSGTDPEGDSGVVVAASTTQLQVDGQTKIDSRLDSVTINSGGTFQVLSPSGLAFNIDSAGRSTVSVPTKQITASESPFNVSSQDTFILVDSTNGPVTLTLPNAGSIGDGRVYVVKDAGTGTGNSVTISTSGGDVDSNPTLIADDDFAGAVLVSAFGNYWIV